MSTRTHDPRPVELRAAQALVHAARADLMGACMELAKGVEWTRGYKALMYALDRERDAAEYLARVSPPPTVAR